MSYRQASPQVGRSSLTDEALALAIQQNAAIANGAASASVDASYLTTVAEPELPNARILTQGANIALTDAGGGSTETVAAAIGPPAIFLVDATVAPATVALPSALALGQRAIIQKIDASANGVGGAPNLTDTINGANADTPAITSQWAVIALEVVAVGAWAIL